MYQNTVTVEQFCKHLSEKYLRGMRYDQVDFEAIGHRIDRQNLTVAEEKRVREFVSQKRVEMLEAFHREKREAAAAKKLPRGFLKFPFLNMGAAVPA